MKKTGAPNSNLTYSYDAFNTAVFIDDMYFKRGDPEPGDMVPAFSLETTDGGPFDSTDLGDQPVFLLFGSRTCPLTTNSGDHLNTLYKRYGDKIRFVFVYTREAHPGQTIAQSKTIEEKQERAIALKAHLNFPFEVATDGIDGALHRALSPKPNSAYLLDPDGTILYRAQWANDIKELDPTLKAAAKGVAMPRRKSSAMIRPMLMAIGYFPEILCEAGDKAKRDIWRAAPPLAILSNLSRLFPFVSAERRGPLATLLLLLVLFLVGWIVMQRVYHCMGTSITGTPVMGH